MVGTSKVLTVSYGTFACTLEGFDDSFSTMKAIAEYFRDLAADDRYFGAEPPVPDAEMLARIAEREVSRRVEARLDGNGVTLRPAATMASALALDSAAEPEVDAEPDTIDAAHEVDEAPVPEAVAGDETSEAPEGAAEVAPETDIDQPEEEADAPAEVSAEQPVAAQEDNAPEARPAPTPARDSDDVDMAALSARIAATSADDAAQEADDLEIAFEGDVVEDDPAPAPRVERRSPRTGIYEDEELDEVEETADEIDDPSSVAAKLRRIRAVVQQEESQENNSDYSEDEHAVPFFDDEAEAESALSEDQIEAEDQPDAQAQAAAEAKAAREAKRARKAERRAKKAAKRAAKEAADAKALEAFERDVDAEEKAEAEARDDADAAAVLRATQAKLQDDAKAKAEEAASGEDQPESETASPQPIRPRVLKVNRQEYQAAVEAGRGEAYIAEQAAAAASAKKAEEQGSSLSEEDEAELMAELAQVEAEAAQATDGPARENADGLDENALAQAVQGATSDASVDEAEVEAAPVTPRRAKRKERLEGAIGDDDPSVSRILEQTNSELERTESSRRRAAIAHLKAAVAATKAERAEGDAEKIDPAAETAAYRDDLAQVVRPKRRASKGKDERPRPAPLMLVSEQRIDEAEEIEGETGPVVTPRRVAKEAPLGRATDIAAMGEEADIDNMFAGDDGDFRSFAAEVGANGLPDILEAAAAYTCFVEGRTSFTRPQVMKTVAALDGVGAVSREEGLRSFGTLLRQGKIRKLKRGQFTIAETTRFRPEAQSA